MREKSRLIMSLTGMGVLILVFFILNVSHIYTHSHKLIRNRKSYMHRK